MGKATKKWTWKWDVSKLSMDWVFPHYHCVHHLIRFLKLLPNHGMIPTWIRLRFPVLHHWFGIVLPALCQDMFNDVQCRLYGCDYGCVRWDSRICCFHVVAVESFVVVLGNEKSPQLRMYRFTRLHLRSPQQPWLLQMAPRDGEPCRWKDPPGDVFGKKASLARAKRWRIRHVQSQKFGRNFKMPCFLQDFFFLEWLMS